MAVRARHVARDGRHHRGRERHRRVRAVSPPPDARERVPRAHRGNGGGPVTRLVNAELLKLRTTRTFWALAGSAAALVLLIVVLTLIFDDQLNTSDDVESLLSAGGLAGLLTLV